MDAETYRRWNTYKRQYARPSKRRKPNRKSGTPTMKTEAHIQHNRQRVDTSQVRYETLLDKQYMVLPVVMMVEGVHNGSTALYYPADELSRVPVGWNMKPIVVYHPAHGSATDPVELQTRMVGHVMNCRWDGKLQAEAWIIPERLEAIAPEVFERLKKGETIEVSTGLYCEYEKASGRWNDEDFELVGRNIVPDHLAILPDMTGACSIKDGCGLLATNQVKMFIDGTPGTYTVNSVSALLTNHSKKESVPMFLSEQQTPSAEGLPLPTMNFESAGNAPVCPCKATNNADTLSLPTMNFDAAQGKDAARIVQNDADTLPLPSMF